jgi:hypothetical protein
MKKLRLLLTLILAVTASVSAASLLLPKPADVDVRADYSPIATSVVLIDVLLALGAALLFWLALKRFKPELKPAYRLLSLSTVSVGLGLLIFPYIEYYGLWDNIWLNMSSYLQYLIGAPLMFLGIRMFYKRVGLGGWPTSFIVLGVAVLVLLGVHTQLPYDGSWPFPVWGYNLFKVVTIIPFVAYAMSYFMALRLRKRTGAEYTTAFTWLSIGLFFYVINTLGIILIEVIGSENVYYANRIYTVPAILGDLGLLLAGYCFAAIGLPKIAAIKGTASSMDIIIYAASKTSAADKVDPLLDTMRTVTARLRLHPDEPLSDTDQRELLGVYMKVEDFLVNSDPLRSFKRDELRADIGQHLGLEAGASTTFWPMLRKD